MVIPPVLFWCLDELLVRQQRSPKRSGILLGLLCAAQFLIDAEVLIFCGILAAIGLVFLALAHRRQVVASLRAAAPGLFAAGGCFALVVAYPVAYFLAGPRRIPHGITLAWITAGYRLDLLRPVLISVPQMIVGGPIVQNGRLVPVVHIPCP